MCYHGGVAYPGSLGIIKLSLVSDLVNGHMGVQVEQHGGFFRHINHIWSPDDLNTTKVKFYKGCTS